MITSAQLLSGLTSGLASGSLKVIDLTETLTPDYPTIQLPEEFGKAMPFSTQEISHYDERGPLWRWSNFTMSEHTGTHLDAPAHWISGKDLPDNTVDKLPLEKMIAPVCVIDASKETAANKDFILTTDFIKQWEAEHGEIEAGSWVFLRTDWRIVADPENYANMQEDGAHSPGPDVEAVKFLIERDVLGFGTECIGTDAGQSFAFDPPMPCHHLMHGSGRLGLQCMTNLDLLPAKGALIISTPLKIEDGSGSPLRVIALLAL